MKEADFDQLERLLQRRKVILSQLHVVERDIESFYASFVSSENPVTSPGGTRSTRAQGFGGSLNEETKSRKILNAIISRGGAATPLEIAQTVEKRGDLTKKEKASIRSLLFTLRSKYGSVESIGGKWRLTEKTRVALGLTEKEGSPEGEP